MYIATKNAKHKLLVNILRQNIQGLCPLILGSDVLLAFFLAVDAAACMCTSMYWHLQIIQQHTWMVSCCGLAASSGSWGVRVLAHSSDYSYVLSRY